MNPFLTPDSEQVTRDALNLLADRLEAALHRHVLDAWLDVCLDAEHGGFLCDFDSHWRMAGPHHKLLEFQARQTWFFAEASLMYPADGRLRAAAWQGFRCLADTLWDDEYGGWHHMTDREGRVLELGTKHVHGMAYAIPACLSVAAATGEQEPLALARQGLDWVEAHSHDRVHGGYYGFLQRDGEPLVERGQGGWEASVDSIATPLGHKDANVHTDLLETFVYSSRVWPGDVLLQARLDELVDIAVTRMTLGGMVYHTFCLPDWTPVPGPSRFGFSFQAAHRLLAGRPFVLDAYAAPAARRLVDCALERGWDRRRGGFVFAADAANGWAPHAVDRTKAMWVQVEALWALVLLGMEEGDEAAYWRYVEALWQYIEKRVLDRAGTGLFDQGVDSMPRGLWLDMAGLNLAPAAYKRKGHLWKDASHEGRSLMRCIRALRGSPTGGGCPQAFPFDRLATMVVPGQTGVHETNGH